MSFKMTVQYAGFFTDLIKAVSAVVDEGDFKATATGLRLISMDPAHISLVDFELPKDSVEEYELSGDVEITINMLELLKFLRRAKKNESLTLNYDSEKRKLTIILTNQAAARERTFQLSTLEPVEGGRTTAPRLTFDATARISTEALWEAIEDSSLVADSMKVTIARDTVVFTARGELGTVENKLTVDGAMVHEVNAQKEASATFALTYLEKIVKAGKDLSEETLLMLSMNKPIKIGFPLPNARLEYLIAPRLE
ncbi:MAG: proliferating cell nuclear antigen (pcna) [Aigarchaeota archaeon]|nr:proliferating cell nuclear antigen (pcna) [Aigarchaeota archaeon]MDW8092481.1 proliferating cell nuclear antigen (pcna) [Nitrososphaerota archaeon]